MKIGQKVVCIQSCTNPPGTASVKKGQIYTIIDTKTCSYCGQHWVDVGIRVPAGLGLCTCLRILNRNGTAHCNPILFRPIEYNSAHDELIKQIVTEKPDIIEVDKPVEV